MGGYRSNRIYQPNCSSCYISIGYRVYWSYVRCINFVNYLSYLRHASARTRTALYCNRSRANAPLASRHSIRSFPRQPSILYFKCCFCSLKTYYCIGTRLDYVHSLVADSDFRGRQGETSSTHQQQWCNIACVQNAISKKYHFL